MKELGCQNLSFFLFHARIIPTGRWRNQSSAWFFIMLSLMTFRKTIFWRFVHTYHFDLAFLRWWKINGLGRHHRCVFRISNDMRNVVIKRLRWCESKHLCNFTNTKNLNDIGHEMRMNMYDVAQRKMLKKFVAQMDSILFVAMRWRRRCHQCGLLGEESVPADFLTMII